VLYDIDADAAGWVAAIAGKTISFQYNLDDLDDFGVFAFPGPLTATGAGPIPSGFLPGNVTIDRIIHPGGGGVLGLIAVGPSSGYTVSNAVLANSFTDSIESEDSTGQRCAYNFNAVSVQGRDSLKITVTDVLDIEAVFIPTPTVGPSGHRLGIIASEGIKSIKLYDENGGHEGTQGNHIWYSCNSNNRPPDADCQDLTLSADGGCEGLATADEVGFESSDPDGDPLTLVLHPPAPYPLGVTEVTLTVTDPSGESASCTATVTVADNELPKITCPTNISFNSDPGQCDAFVTYTAPVGTDNCPGGEIATRTAGLGSGDVFPVGTTTQTYTVTDGADHTAACSFSVTVVDNELPVAICVPGPNSGGVIAPAGNQAFWTISGTDNCPDGLSIVVEDTGTKTALDGPFTEATNVKYVQVPGTKIPKQKPGNGFVDWKLTVSGYMKVIATDAAGNTGDVLCLAPQRVLLRRS
jgi:hypothetical protein